MLCLIGFDNHKVIKDFIRIHVEDLPEDKICVNGLFPNYQYLGENIRRKYELNFWKKRLLSFAPYSLTSRIQAHLATSPVAIRRSLGTFFRDKGVDVILAEFGHIGARIAGLAADLHIPLVVHFHGHDAHRVDLLTKEIREQYNFMFNSAAAILVVSRFMLKTLKELGCGPEKLIYNPYGPRDKFFKLTPDYRPTVLSVGRFTDIKANYLVLMAFQRALHTHPSAQLVMAGDGELLETCKTIATGLKIEHQVQFLGSVEHSQVHKLYSEACCFAQHSVSPSYGDAEGTPNTILEASASALPVVATNHAGIPDVVRHGKSGFLVEERDIEGMGNYLSQLLSDESLCKELGKTGRQRVQKHFNSKLHIERLSRAIQLARLGDKSGISDLAKESMFIGIED